MMSLLDRHALVREWSERDYGIDFVVELFSDGIPTGQIAFLQVKGTKNSIEKLKKTEEVSCPNVSVSCLKYAKQRRIPFIFIYASTADPQLFYYVDLQRVVDDVEQGLDLKQKQVNIRIPAKNVVKENLTGLFD